MPRRLAEKPLRKQRFGKVVVCFGVRWIEQKALLVGGNRFIQGEGSSGRVAVLEISGEKVEMTDVATGLDGPVGVTVIGDTAYVVEGKIGYLIDPALRDKNPEPFLIRAFALPGRP